MLRTLKLLLPALVPSWRFFDTIAPSPRIQYTLLKTKTEIPEDWHDFRPRPARVSIKHMLGRLFWNPRWNESLYLVSCAERLMQHPTPHSEYEILNRIIDDCHTNGLITKVNSFTHVQFRLLFVYRHANDLHQEVTFYSRIESLSNQCAV